MSGVGNDSTFGNNKSNYHWQLSMLQMLGENNTELKTIASLLGGVPSTDYELWVAAYKANKTGTGYSAGDYLQRVIVINAATGVQTSTLWFNENLGNAIPAPPQGDVDPYNSPSASPSSYVSGKTASITGTSDTQVIPAPTGGLKLLINQILVTNGHASVGTYVNIKDGTTILYTGYAAAAGGGFSLNFPTPLVVSGALNVANETTGSDVRVSASGYKSA